MPTANDILQAKRPRREVPGLRERVLSLLGFICLFVAVALPVLCWTFWWPQSLLYVACAAGFAAFALGLRGWPRFLAKITILGSLLFAIAAVRLWERGLPTYQQKIHPTADWMMPLDSTWVLQSPGESYSIRTASDMEWRHTGSLRFELRGGEDWVDQTFIHSFRSEVATKDFPPNDSVRWYSFSVYFPPDFPIESNRLVFAQWHSHWQFRQPGRIPALAFRFVNGRLSITLRHSPEISILNPDSVPSEDLFKNNHFRIGQWHDFVIQTKWSYRDDGFVNVWWNGEQIVAYKGPVGYNEPAAPEFKFGLYRDATVSTYIDYFNHVKTGENPRDVDFDPATARPYQRDN